MAYVYTHTRLDKNEVFYVGIGSDDKHYRAYTIKGRNTYWYRIIKKTDYTVSIVFDNLTWEEACIKEIELIKHFGQKIFKSGTLVNLTSGGDGFKKNHTKKTKTKISKSLSGKTYDELHGKNADIEREKRKKSVKKYWNSLTKEERKQRSDKHKGLRGTQKNPEHPIKCPYCDVIGRASLMKRWHFENCKKHVKKR